MSVKVNKNLMNSLYGFVCVAPTDLPFFFIDAFSGFVLEPIQAAFGQNTGYTHGQVASSLQGVG